MKKPALEQQEDVKKCVALIAKTGPGIYKAAAQKQIDKQVFDSGLIVELHWQLHQSKPFRVKGITTKNFADTCPEELKEAINNYINKYK